jgi:hypothetical protein
MVNSNNPYIPQVERFTASSEFHYLGDFFRDNEFYCPYGEGTEEHLEFWKDVKNKCIYGMTNSAGISITGPHFFYLNFCPIQLQKEDKNTGIIRKAYDFPRFVDLDYEYFWMVQYCRLNQKSLIAVKGRRQGWSYKGAAIAANEYTFVRESKSIIGAFLSTYSENTIGMVTEYLNHIAEYTPFGHIRNPDLKTFFKSQYQKIVNGVKVTAGYKSSVEALTFKDRPAVAAGKSCSILLLDEAGLFPNITESWGYTEPLIKDGSSYTGTAIIYGSSGDMDSGSKYFYEMFTNPRNYNMLEFEDPEDPSKMIGYFSSATKGRWGICKNPNSMWYKQPMVDENGNSNQEAAFDDLMWVREQTKGGLDPKALHLATTQFPVTWKEAFLRNKGAIFASPEMHDWLGILETTPAIRENKKVGELYFDSEGKLLFRPNPDLHEITEFPVGRKEQDGEYKGVDGAIVIYEDPETVNGIIPHGLYIAGCDPYDMDKSGTNSLGSFFVYKRFYSANKTHDIIVAEYTGRPQFADTFYENCRKLCIYYNSKVLYENMLKGFKGYFEQKNCLQYLYEQPAIIKDIVKDSRVSRGYGIHMQRGQNGSSGIKDTCELYLKDWLYTERHEADGKKILNLHTIRNIALLKELLAYDMEGNYDRVVAFMLCILQAKDIHRIHLNEQLNNPNNNQLSYLESIYKRNTMQRSNFKSPFITR